MGFPKAVNVEHRGTQTILRDADTEEVLVGYKSAKTDYAKTPKVTITMELPVRKYDFVEEQLSLLDDDDIEEEISNGENEFGSEYEGFDAEVIDADFTEGPITDDSRLLEAPVE